MLLLLGHKAFSKLLQVDLLILLQVKAFLVAVCMCNHTDLSFHLDNSSITKVYLLTLGFSLLVQTINSFQELFLVVALLPNVCLHLLIV